MEMHKVKELVETALTTHGLVGWTFKSSTALGYAGQCRYLKKEIAISVPWARALSDEKIMDTILHEVAHALKMTRGLPGTGHGKEWKKVAREVGATPRASFKATPAEMAIAKGIKAPTNGYVPQSVPRVTVAMSRPRRVTPTGKPAQDFSRGFTDIEALFGDEYE